MAYVPGFLTLAKDSLVEFKEEVLSRDTDPSSFALAVFLTVAWWPLDLPVAIAGLAAQPNPAVTVNLDLTS